MNEPLYNGPLAKLPRDIIAYRTPDPWSQEDADAVRSADAIPLCIECLHPVERHYWFCSHCRFPVADTLMLNPFFQIFAIGEVARRGVIGPPEKGAIKKIGFVIFSVWQYGVFAPIYWFWMVRRARGHPICYAMRKPLETEEEKGFSE